MQRAGADIDELLLQNQSFQAASNMNGPDEASQLQGNSFVQQKDLILAMNKLDRAQPMFVENTSLQISSPLSQNTFSFPDPPP